jgi:HSF-type DNA-binding
MNNNNIFSYPETYWGPFATTTDANANATTANSMRQAPQDAAQQQQQLQNMMMATAVPTPNAMPFLKQQQQAMSQPQLSSNLMQGMHNYQLQQQQQQQPGEQMFAAASARSQYQPQQQQQLQQAFFDPTRPDSTQGLLAAAMAGQQQQPTYQDMMYMQQQQQRRGSDAAAQAAAFNMTLGGYGGTAMGQQYGTTMATTTTQPQQQQFGQQQQQPQMWMNESQMQQASFQEQLQLMNSAYFLPQQQQQQQFEPLRRRRSSMSSTGSLSPIGPGRRPSLGNNSNIFFGNAEYARYAAAASSVPLPPVPNLTLAPQQQQQDDPLLGVGTAGLQASLLNRKDKKKRAKTFPEKLMQAMMDHANESAVAWLPDGKSFVIVSPDIFVKEVLNSVFKQAKYASFVRKLHRWGFVRLTSGTGTDCFHHPLFNRNRREWASKITCAPVRDSGNNKEMAAVPKAQPRGAGPDKPPSLAGVERFIRAKAAAEALAAQAVDIKGKHNTLPSMPEESYLGGAEGGHSLGFPDPIKGGNVGHGDDPFAGSHLGDKEMVGRRAMAEPVKGVLSKAPSSGSEVEDEHLGIGATAV